MKTKSSDLDFTWVRSIGRLWILKMEKISVFTMIGAVLAAIVLSFIGLSSLAPAAFLALLATSFLVEMTHYWLFYHAIRCPECGLNPTRFKNGKNLPRKMAWKRLKAISVCQHHQLSDAEEA